MGVVDEPQRVSVYLKILRSGFKRALGYELLSFLSIWLLVKSTLTGESTWALKIRHILLLGLSWW